ncbi:MAG: hypothetical protein LBQ01_03850 [Prevotellaceae bacterium]|nr:hypothetical protein [Prevotellaceae bacterium]
MYYGRVTRYIGTNQNVTVQEWNRLVKNTKDDSLSAIKNDLFAWYKKIYTHVTEITGSGDFSFDLLNKRIKTGSNENINDALEARIKELNEQAGLAHVIFSQMH